MKVNYGCFCCQFCKLCEFFTCLHFALRHFPRQSGQVKQSGKSYFKICKSLVANIRDDSICKYWNNFTVSRLYLMMTSTCKTGRIYPKIRRRECCFGSNVPQSMFVNLLQLIFFSWAVSEHSCRQGVGSRPAVQSFCFFALFFTSSWPPAHLTAKSSTSDTQLTLSWRTCPKKSFVQNQNMGRHRKNKLSQLQKILMEIWVCEYMIFYLKQNTLLEIRFRK